MVLSDCSYDDEIDSPDPQIIPVILRTVKDPIHAMIPLTPKLSAFIDTKQFQRLRYIKQLGTSYYVWLGAAHNRFEHCIGVAYLARSMATHLQKSQPELRIVDRDIECVEIAGLCHDLGHGPWSHVWDGLFMPQAIPDCHWKHEDGSEMMFDSLVKENRIRLKKKDERFIKALIAGEPSRCDPDEKPFLFDIVANKRNGLDVDKFDYILRDSHMVGDPMSIALPRIIQSARVLDNQICYDIKDANQIYEICAMRFKLHKIVYNHKSAKAIEYMIIDGLLAAEPHLGIAKRVQDPKQYLYLTDDIMPQIEASTIPELAPARAIFDRIRTRDLYRCVDYKVIDWPSIDVVQTHMTSERIVAAAKALPTHPPSIGAGDTMPVDVDALTKVDVVVDFSLMHYGMKERNPLDFVKFYSKRNPNRGASAGPGDYSNLMPQYHAELLMRIYTKKVEYYGLIQAGYRVCLAEINGLLNSGMSPTLAPTVPSSDPNVGGREAEDSMAPTPATGAPTTPHVSASPSFNFGMGGTPLIPNDFMTVPKDFAPKSPSRRPAVVMVKGAVGGGGGGRDTSPSPSPSGKGNGSGSLSVARVGAAGVDVGAGVGAGPGVAASASTNPTGVGVRAGMKRGREESVGMVDSEGKRKESRSRERRGGGRKRRWGERGRGGDDLR